MGRYAPPDLEGVASFNTASGKGHALGARARKLKSEGILTVRFECPFAIWCTTCRPEQIIAQGVRFNAEKKKVGNYFSSPIWAFRFKHTVCGGTIEVRTDPKASEYVVTEGARRRDYGADDIRDGEVRVGVSEAEKERLEKDGAFGALEKKVADKSAADAQRERVAELMRASERDWKDPYEMSRKLRAEFRVGRRKRQRDELSGEALKQKFGLEVEMMPEEEGDAERARFVEFGEQNSKQDGLSVAKPMFVGRDAEGGPREDLSTTTNTSATSKSQAKSKSTSTSSSSSSSSLSATANKSNRTSAPKVDKKEVLGNTLRGNTRIATDPFLREEDVWQPKVKRKRPEPQQQQQQQQESTQHTSIEAEKTGTEQDREVGKSESNAAKSKALVVGYDSDSDS